MTIRVHEDGGDRTGNNFANFSSAFPSGEPDQRDQRNQPQHQLQSMTGIRINMAGELLNGTANEQESYNSEDMLDSVELGIINGYENKAEMKKKNDRNQEIANFTHETSSEEEARNNTEAIEVSYKQSRAGEVGQDVKQKKLKYSGLRCWKSQTKMAIIFSIITLFFVFLAFLARSGLESISWD